ncbi:MAG: folylpolyglutamate synthase/dihydrofolate synthase family protein [Bacteroidales bacterium]|nr:folylpolyglutamate synthase/dihydrofolate synthase family protein [Bacteroidales bacterium]
MTYEKILEDIYNRFPVYQQVGAVALKPGLGNILRIDERLGHPHHKFKTIHVAGTNGKGSVSHTLAAILQSAGYVTGLFTSPHLVDFRERIRIDGCMIPKECVVEFMDRNDMFLNDLQPSFFEITTAMALDYFERVGVDVAVIEVGLGGRLDSTNIITPDLSVITNIGLEHTQYLGDTLGKIAGEKAGIIKPGVPVVIGERNPETDPVFIAKAQEQGSEIFFAEDMAKILSHKEDKGQMVAQVEHAGQQPAREHRFSLTGLCQTRNLLTVLAAVDVLKKQGYDITELDIREGMADVQGLTGLMGRWQKIGMRPDIIVDTGHNAHGVKILSEQLEEQFSKYIHVHIVWGMCNDKDPEKVLSLLPRDARYYFTQANNTRRATPASELYEIGQKLGLNCHFYPTVAQAMDRARRYAEPADLIFVGGSNFIVGEVIGSQSNN